MIIRDVYDPLREKLPIVLKENRRLGIQSQCLPMEVYNDHHDSLQETNNLWFVFPWRMLLVEGLIV